MSLRALIMAFTSTARPLARRRRAAREGGAGGEMRDAGGLGRESVYRPALLQHYPTLPARRPDLDDGGLQAAVVAGTGVADKWAEKGMRG